jgi:hypothetical protein
MLFTATAIGHAMSLRCPSASEATPCLDGLDSERIESCHGDAHLKSPGGAMHQPG